MSIHRFFKRQFLVRSRVRAVAFLFCILLIFGCGREETANNPVVETASGVTPDEAALISTKYFPMTVGSRWVYRHSDGSEWQREITDARKIGNHTYFFFSHDRPMENPHLDSFRAPAYTLGLNRFVLLMKAMELENLVGQAILESGGNLGSLRHRFHNGEWRTTVTGEGFVILHTYKTQVGRHSDSVPIRLPLNPGMTYEALDMTMRGSIEGAQIVHSFEAQWVVSGSVGFPETIVTPAGSFPGCLKIQYGAEQTVETEEFRTGGLIPKESARSLLDLLEADVREELMELLNVIFPKLGFENLWIAPGVGPVKIETPNGIAELIDYEIKTVASGQ